MVLDSQAKAAARCPQIHHALTVCAVYRSPLFSSPPLPNSPELEQCGRTAAEDYRGVGFFRRMRPSGMEGRRGLHDLPAVHLWRRSALPHDGGLQPQAEAAPTG